MPALGLSLLACGAPEQPPPETEGRIVFEHAGLEREYWLDRPPTTSEPMPLILSFHGLFADMQRQRELSAMAEDATARGMAIAFPNGLANGWDAGDCCAPPDPDRDDIAFVEALIADVASRIPIDTSRVFATGMSNGAALAHRLACHAPELVAAIGPVTSRRRVEESSCVEVLPTSIVHFHGSDDGVAPYQEARDQFPEWAARNGCAEPPAIVIETEGAACDGYTVCDGGAEVWFCTVEGMGHCWPGSGSCDAGAPSTALDANQVMLDFFRASPEGS